MEPIIELTGITWNHTRGYLPMVATAQRFSELYPEVSITWHKRSLQQFADAPLADLASRFDLMVIDHPSVGEAVHQNLLLPLDEHLAPAFLADQAANPVGQSHSSYHYDGHQYVLAIDAAAPISGWRPDLIGAQELPKTWPDLIALARRGLVTVPAIPIDSLMNLFMLANALGAEPFTTPGEVIAPGKGTEALKLLRELVQLSAPGSLARNPIKTWQFLAESDTAAYCPFAYGYSNYSRPGYAANILHTGGLVSLESGGASLRSTLGGAGLAISRTCKHPGLALAYAEFTASPAIQTTLYTHSGGQPGHRAAWLDPTLNAATNFFFSATLPTLDSAWVRPRFPGFIAFQDAASNLVHHYLIHGGPESDVLHAMNSALKAAQA